MEIILVGAAFLMCGLKLAGIGLPAKWSWFWCMSPVLIPVIIGLLVGLFYFAIGMSVR
jgi:hypothetical protein